MTWPSGDDPTLWYIDELTSGATSWDNKGTAGATGDLTIEAGGSIVDGGIDTLADGTGYAEATGLSLSGWDSGAGSSSDANFTVAIRYVPAATRTDDTWLFALSLGATGNFSDRYQIRQSDRGSNQYRYQHDLRFTGGPGGTYDETSLLHDGNIGPGTGTDVEVFVVRVIHTGSQIEHHWYESEGGTSGVRNVSSVEHETQSWSVLKLGRSYQNGQDQVAKIRGFALWERDIGGTAAAAITPTDTEWSSAGGGGPALSTDAGGPYTADIDVAEQLAGSPAGGTTPYTHAWSATSSPAGSVVSFSNAAVEDPTVTVDIPGSYTLQYQVTDNDSTVVSDTATLTASAPAVVAGAGPDAATQINTNLALNGSGSGGYGALSYAWSVISQPGGSAVSFSPSANVEDPTIQLDTVGSYTLRLTVTDSDPTGPTAQTDDVVITGQLDPPVVSAGLDASTQINVALGLAGSVTSTEPVTAAWSVVSSPMGSGVVFSDASSPTSTVTVDTVGSYTLRLTGDDSINSPVTDDVVVTGQLDAPLVDAGSDFGLGTDVSGNMAGVVTSNEPSTSTTWSKVSGPGAVVFGDASSLSSTVTIDTAGTHVLRLTADDGVNAAVTDDVTVTVTDPVAPPDDEFPVRLMFRDGQLRLRTQQMFR